ncbi:MAG: RidA family protein [Dehalococcoidia bacterium]|jgi:2-iminobutanoate/2-iminopropanoate deaminase|nr:RidA family protein [Dehalococcoidia bacterium]MDP6227716.1 RidA family protein [Dehalococcoidia bacterium]MDP7200899.1 RidA family protein [Dehalococcoidia bacterium]MDP7510161.1 RidA family protein [Dehalococcoidia bacterium]HJN87407.1 RidA family protein [Dehalococcoidia bacterium]
MMDVIRRDHSNIALAGPTYSRSVRTGSWLFISGCTARGTEAQGKPLMEQLRVTIDRITRIVAAEGGTPSGIVKTTTFVTSIADWRANAAEQQALFEEFFKGEYPANTLVEITALAQPGLDVEIEATVVLD